MRTLIWLPVVLFIGLALYAVVVQINWGYHIERGYVIASFAASELDEEDPKASSALASEICGEDAVFTKGKTKHPWYATMPEHKEVGHFFVHSPFREVVWITVGTDQWSCLARYEVVMQDRGQIIWIPRWLLPYPEFGWFKELHLVSRRLLERIPRPKAPDGIHALLPGECVSGTLHPGETVRYRTQLPKFGQRIKVSPDWDWPGGEPMQVSLTKDGQRMNSYHDVDDNGGGIYDIVLHNQVAVSRQFTFNIGWGNVGFCPTTDAWWTYDVPPPPGH